MVQERKQDNEPTVRQIVRKKKISTIIKESALAYYNYTMLGGGSETINIERDFIATRIVAHIDTADVSKEIMVKVNRRGMFNIDIPTYLFKDSRYPFKFPTPYYMAAGTELKIEGIGSLSTASYFSFEGFFVKPLPSDQIATLFTPYVYAIKDVVSPSTVYTSSEPLPILREYDFQLTSLVALVWDATATSYLTDLNFTTNIKKQNGVKLYRDDTHGDVVYGTPEYPHKLNLPVTFRGGTSLLPNITVNSGAYTNQVSIWRFLIGRNL